MNNTFLVRNIQWKLNLLLKKPTFKTLNKVLPYQLLLFIKIFLYYSHLVTWIQTVYFLINVFDDCIY